MKKFFSSFMLIIFSLAIAACSGSNGGKRDAFSILEKPDLIYPNSNELFSPELMVENKWMKTEFDKPYLEAQQILFGKTLLSDQKLSREDINFIRKAGAAVSTKNIRYKLIKEYNALTDINFFLDFITGRSRVVYFVNPQGESQRLIENQKNNLPFTSGPTVTVNPSALIQTQIRDAISELNTK